MIVMENNCADCAIPCVGGHCPLADCPTACCDCCGESAELFYVLDGEYLCRSCFIEAMLEGAETVTAEELMD